MADDAAQRSGNAGTADADAPAHPDALPPDLRRPPRIGAALEPGAGPARAAAAARLEDTAPLVTAPSRHAAASEPVAVLIPAHEPEPADWPRLFGPHQRLGKIAAALRRELRETVPRLPMPAVPAAPSPWPSVPPSPPPSPSLPQLWSQEQTVGELVAALAQLDEAYDRGACAARPLVTAVRWHLVRMLADLLRDLRDEVSDLITAPDPEPAPLSPHAFALVRALCSAACLRISALSQELATQLAGEGQRRSPLWNAVRRLQRSAEDVSVLCMGEDAAPAPTGSDGASSRYAVARTALQSQLSAMRRESHAA
jgi:hypothetical protein